MSNEPHSVSFDTLSVLKFNVLLMGLFENFIILPDIIKENNVTSYTFEKAYLDVGMDTCNSLRISEKKDDNKNELYGIVDYEMARSIFYTRGKRNEELIKARYKFGYYKHLNESKKVAEDLRFFELTEDDGDTLYLRNNQENVYKNLIGNAIMDIYSEVGCEYRRRRILEYNNMGILSHTLYYFKSYDECLDELQKMLRNNEDIIDTTYSKSCAKFMKYYAELNKIEAIKLSDYKKANAMIIDLCNMIKKTFTFIETVDLYNSSVPVVVEDDLIKIYRSICFNFVMNVNHIRENYHPDLELDMFDSNKKKIYLRNPFYKIFSNKILIPIEYLKTYGIHYINIKLGGARTGLVDLSDYFVKKN